MANEGSTKPTYSELEAELLRVRGLLQRGFALMNGMGGKHGSLGQMDGWRILFDTLEEALGAESADIGKLDSADKCLCGHGIGNHTDRDGRVVDGHCSLCMMDGCSANGYRRIGDVEDAGIAETGGEKAARAELAEGSHPLLDFNEFDYEDCAACAFVETDPCPYHIGFANGAKWGVANFRSTSQNQTVSIGVEGAHEGTTADKSGWATANTVNRPRLAESSLSSPKEKDPGK